MTKKSSAKIADKHSSSPLANKNSSQARASLMSLKDAKNAVMLASKALVVVAEILVENAKCIQRLVHLAVKNVRFLLSQKVTVQYIVTTVSRNN